MQYLPTTFAILRWLVGTIPDELTEAFRKSRGLAATERLILSENSRFRTTTTIIRRAVVKALSLALWNNKSSQNVGTPETVTKEMVMVMVNAPKHRCAGRNSGNEHMYLMCSMLMAARLLPVCGVQNIVDK